MAYDEDVAERIRALVATRKDVTEKRMFGGLAFLIGGNMAVAASADGGIMLRCPPDETAELAARPAAGDMIMSGRAVRGWVRVDTTGMTDAAFAEWVARGVDHAATLPPKR